MLRRQAWETNLKYIKQHNSESDKGIHTFTVAMNEFGDMIGDEFKALYFNAKLKTKETFMSKERWFRPEIWACSKFNYTNNVEFASNRKFIWNPNAIVLYESLHFKCVEQ